jgi:hypothetical protein
LLHGPPEKSYDAAWRIGIVPDRDERIAACTIGCTRCPRPPGACAGCSPSRWWRRCSSRSAGTTLFEALQAGASGFVLKDAEPAELLRAVRVVAAGEALLSPSVTRRVVSLFGRHLAGGTPRHPAWMR